MTHYDQVVRAVREMMNRIALQGKSLVHTVFESVEGGQRGFLIYRADHFGVTTPIVVWVDRARDEVGLGLSYLDKDQNVICKAVPISALADLTEVEHSLTSSLAR